MTRLPVLKIWSVVAVALLVVGLEATPALAEAGSCPDDPDDTFMDPEGPFGPGSLDLVEMAHDDTDDTITYDLTTDEVFDAGDVGNITWHIDEGADDQFEGSVVVFGDLQGAVRDSQGQQVATATVVHDDGTNELRTTFSRDGLEQIGVEGSYDYAVVTEESDEYRFDAGGPCTHTLVQDDPTPTATTGTVALDDTTIPEGGTLSGEALDFDPGSNATVTVMSDPVVLGSTTVGDNGDVRFSFPLPSSVTPGAHTVEVRGVGENDGTRVATAGFTVVAAQVTPTASPVPVGEDTTEDDSLPSTGSPIEFNLRVALLLLLTGATLIFFTGGRSRRPVYAGASVSPVAEASPQLFIHTRREAAHASVYASQVALAMTRPGVASVDLGGMTDNGEPRLDDPEFAFAPPAGRRRLPFGGFSRR